MSTTGVHKSEKKEVCGQPTAEARARARDGSRSRRGAPAEQGEAGSGHGRRPLSKCLYYFPLFYYFMCNLDVTGGATLDVTRVQPSNSSAHL